MSGTPYDGKIAMVHWDGRSVGEETIGEIVATLQEWAPNVKAIWVKVLDGDQWQGAYDRSGKQDLVINGPSDLARWVRECGAAGIDVHAWCVVRGKNPAKEAALIVDACQVDGVKSMILDVEVGEQYFRGGPRAARELAEKIRREIPGRFHLALNLDARGNHPRDIHIQEWWPFIDSLHPMVYHEVFGLPPDTAVANAFEALAQYSRPVIPMLQAYDIHDANGLKIAADTAFRDYNAPGISFFRTGTAGSQEYRVIQTITTPERPDEEGVPVEVAADFTNQELINAFSEAAGVKGEHYWDWIVSAGLEWLANNRQAFYRGTPIDALPGLMQSEKHLIKKALAGEQLEGEPAGEGEAKGIEEKYTNQQIINAFHAAARAMGHPDTTYWKWVIAADLESIADNRNAIYTGPDPMALPNLSEAVKKAIAAELDAVTGVGSGHALEVPWISQMDPDAPGPNDCGQACVLMLLKYYGKVGDSVTVKNLTDIRGGKTDAVALRSLAARFGLSLTATFASVDGMRAAINKGHPVILLVNYKDLRFTSPLRTQDQGWHWLLAIGHQGDEFTLHDPLWMSSWRNGRGGANLSIARSTLESAIVGYTNALYHAT